MLNEICERPKNYTIGKNPNSRNGFQKGQHSSTKTEFKKGHIPWHKGKKCPHLTGENACHWKGGKTIENGYILIYKLTHPFATQTGYVLEHRFIVEQQIGRYLLPEETVHHVNEIKDDNRIENLMLFNGKSAHQRFHYNPDNVKPEEILFDGRKLTIRPRDICGRFM